jgi:hypothetical protein
MRVTVVKPLRKYLRGFHPPMNLDHSKTQRDARTLEISPLGFPLPHCIVDRRDHPLSDITRILTAAATGDAHAAHDLLPLIYGELRKLAAHKMAGEAPGQTLQATALVHKPGCNWPATRNRTGKIARIFSAPPAKRCAASSSIVRDKKKR